MKSIVIAVIMLFPASASDPVTIVPASEWQAGWVSHYRGQDFTYFVDGTLNAPPGIPGYQPGPHPVDLLGAGFHRTAYVCTGNPVRHGVSPGSYLATGHMRRAELGERLGNLVATHDGWKAVKKCPCGDACQCEVCDCE